MIQAIVRSSKWSGPKLAVHADPNKPDSDWIVFFGREGQELPE
jgi:hypothetical protein